MENVHTTPFASIIMLVPILVIFWLLVIHIPAHMARKRNLSVILCILLTLVVDPIVEYIIIALIGKK